MKIQHEGQEVKIAKTQNGHNIWHRITFTAISENKIQDVVELQSLAGYHPAGYGGPWGVSVDERSDGYVTTWKCSASCD